MGRITSRAYRTSTGDWRHTQDAQACDLRKRIRRQAAEQIVARAAFLPPSDRLLVQLYLEHGRTLKDLAEASGLPPRVMSRKMRKLITRVASERFDFVLHHMESWPTGRRKVAIAMVLHGLSIRDAAQTLAVSLYTVRRHHEAVCALFDTEQRAHKSRTLQGAH